MRAKFKSIAITTLSVLSQHCQGYHNTVRAITTVNHKIMNKRMHNKQNNNAAHKMVWAGNNESTWSGHTEPLLWQNRVQSSLITLWLCKSITSWLMTVALLSERRAVVILRPRSASTMVTDSSGLSFWVSRAKSKNNVQNFRHQRYLRKRFHVYGAKFMIKCHIHYNQYSMRNSQWSAINLRTRKSGV